MSSNYTTRLAAISDALLLRELLYEAVTGVGRAKPSKDEVLSDDKVLAFVEGWGGRAGDRGVVAESNLEPVGAAWCRVFDGDDPEGGFVGGQTAELLIALLPEHRGKGVGDLLLNALLARVDEDDGHGLGLNVPRANLPAVSLFRRHGFEVTRDADGVLTMQRRPRTSAG